MRFVKFISLWLVICLLAATALEFAYRNYTTQADQVFTKFNSKANTVEYIYIGNSHVGVFSSLPGLQTPAVVNMSLGGQDIYRMYSVLKTVIPNSPNLKRVYMGLDYDLLGYNQTKNGEEYLDRVYFPYTGEMYNDNFTNRLMSKSSFFRANRDMAYLFSRNKAPKDLNFIPVASNNTAANTQSAPVVKDSTKKTDTTVAVQTAAPVQHKQMDQHMCRKRAEEHTMLKYKQKYINENIGYLKQIIDICQKHNIQLVFFNPPKTECYKGYSYAPNITTAKQTIDSFTIANKATYLDFYNSPAFNDDLFVDFDHLNATGATMLNDSLSAYH